MRVRYRLSGGLAHVDADVITVRNSDRFGVAPHRLHQRPDCGLLDGGERQEVRLVTPWDDEAVARIQRKSVRERGGEIVLGDEIPG